MQVGTYLLRLQIDFRWVWSGMPKDAIKTLRSQKLKEV